MLLVVPVPSCLTERSFEVNLLTFGHMQHQWCAQPEKTKSQKRKEDQGAPKGRKVGNHYVFPMFCGSAGSRSSLAKAAGAGPSCGMRDHAVVARSKFGSKNAKNTA